MTKAPMTKYAMPGRIPVCFGHWALGAWSFLGYLVIGNWDFFLWSLTLPARQTLITHPCDGNSPALLAASFVPEVLCRRRLPEANAFPSRGPWRGSSGSAPG